MGITEILEDVLPIVRKAAPLLCAAINSKLGFVACGVVAAAFGTDANDYTELAKKLSNDPDLYAKLAALEATHGAWLSALEKNQK